MLISQDNKWYEYFNAIIIVITILQVVGYPYLACFRSSSLRTFIIMAHISEIFFLAECVCNFFVKKQEIVESEEDQWTFKKVARRYL